MAVTRIATSSLKNLNKYDSFLGGNAAYVPNNFESIATVTVGGTAQLICEFTSIPSTYKHLQIRGIGRTNQSAGIAGGTGIKLNNNSSGNATTHLLRGNGQNALAGSYTGYNWTFGTWVAGSTATSNTYAAWIIDILDYSNTNKYKTIRMLNGLEQNTTESSVTITSGLVQSTSAVSSIQIDGRDGSWISGTTFALYGVK